MEIFLAYLASSSFTKYIAFWIYSSYFWWLRRTDWFLCLNYSIFSCSSELSFCFYHTYHLYVSVNPVHIDLLLDHLLRQLLVLPDVVLLLLQLLPQQLHPIFHYTHFVIDFFQFVLLVDHRELGVGPFYFLTLCHVNKNNIIKYQFDFIYFIYFLNRLFQFNCIPGPFSYIPIHFYFSSNMISFLLFNPNFSSDLASSLY